MAEIHPPVSGPRDLPRGTKGWPEPMLQPAQNLPAASKFPSNPNPVTAVKTISPPVEQATIGRSVVIKGEISGSESLYIDGRIEGTINFADSRITIGRNGNVAANVNAREVVIIGTVNGNVECTDRLDIRSEGTLNGDVITQRICVEDGAVLKGSVQVRTTEQKHDKSHQAKPVQSVTDSDKPKAMSATAGV